MADEYLTAALYGMKRFNEGMSKKVKELMGMEKLIELLNEYIEENKPKTNLVKEITDGGYFVNNWNDGDGFLCETIMSKKFGFIKWLVENDKIDIESYCRITSIERKGEKDVYRDEVDSLLMLLSIQDNPIEFLVSILK